MTTRTMDCIDCGESVPYGRLSCPACGALLASVAGAYRGPMRVTVGSEPADRDMPPGVLVQTEAWTERDLRPGPEPMIEMPDGSTPVALGEPVEPTVSPDPEPEPVEPVSPDPEPELVASIALESATAAEPETEQPAEPDPEPVAAAEPDPVEPPVSPAPEPEPVAAAEPEAEIEREPLPVAAAEPEAETESEPVAAAAAVVVTASRERATAAPKAARRPSGGKRPMLLPRPYQGLTTIVPDAFARHAAGPPAGYRPPTLALSAAMAGPAWQMTSAGATGVGGSGGVDPSATALETAIEDPAGADAAELVPAARFVEIAGWFVIVGATMTTLGFLLPWSRVVIGAAHIGGYFDSWGLASPTHMLVLAGVLVVLGLGIVPTPIPIWLRTGVLGLATGSLLVGLVWPYIVGPLGADVGVLISGLGALGLVIGGVLASWATRHASDDPAV